jgi:serine/threonine-protein kinase
MPAPEFDALYLEFQAAVAGRYSLERELGRGGMGVVYLAREVRLDRPVAIKLLPPQLATDERLKDRFLREARLAARLSHPYIVPIHAVDEIGGFVFYVMSYVDGETLAQRVAHRGALPPEEATRILREVAWALAYAHGQGVIHRDVKPANILLERGSGRAMVADFGIARLVQTTGETVAGEVLGTPEYMSPEQASGEPLDGRSDLYSLGVTGFYAVTGTLPFTATTAHAMLAQHLTKEPPPVASAAKNLPRSLCMAIDRCLQKDPAARFERGEALADALAPSLEKKADVPVPIRTFLDRRHILPLVFIPVFAAVWAMPMLAFLTRTAPFLIQAGAAIVLGVAALAAPVWYIAYRLRRVLRLGYGPDDIAAGMRGIFERKREEFLFDFGPERGSRERVLGAVSIGALGTALTAGIIASQIKEFTGTFSMAIVTFIISLQVGIISGAFSLRWYRIRKGTAANWLVKFWRGPIGHFLAKVASINLGTRVVAADRPTEMAIATNAGEMYAKLPKPQRQLLGEVPAVLRHLQDQARAMRDRMVELDGAISNAQRSPAGERQAVLVNDLRAARTGSEKRLAEVVGALENLRLDLLRIHAGAGDSDSITRDLDAARSLGEGVDRLIAGKSEIDAALERP